RWGLHGGKREGDWWGRLRAAARIGAGRDEETALGSNQETIAGGRRVVALPSSPGVQWTVWCACHGVPRATTALAKISSLRAQATTATLCSLPAARIRLYRAVSCGFERSEAIHAAT